MWEHIILIPYHKIKIMYGFLFSYMEEKKTDDVEKFGELYFLVD